MPESRAAQKLESLIGTKRTLNEGTHAPVHLRVTRDGGAYAQVEVENSAGVWRCPVSKEGVIQDLVVVRGPQEIPDWVRNVLDNLGFREVPGLAVMP